jgi:hypothetical protein
MLDPSIHGREFRFVVHGKLNLLKAFYRNAGCNDMGLPHHSLEFFSGRSRHSQVHSVLPTLPVVADVARSQPDNGETLHKHNNPETIASSFGELLAVRCVVFAALIGDCE